MSELKRGVHMKVVTAISVSCEILRDVTTKGGSYPAILFGSESNTISGVG